MIEAALDSRRSQILEKGKRKVLLRVEEGKISTTITTIAMHGSEVCHKEEIKIRR